MLRITRPAPNRLDLELDGALDSAAMRAALDSFADHAVGIEHGRMLYRIVDFDLPSLGAIGVEVTRLPQLLSLVRRFDKAAVLTDTRWVGKVSELEGRLFPGLRIKAFDPGQVAQAEAWLAEPS
jgi:hypothetical protein